MVLASEDLITKMILCIFGVIFNTMGSNYTKYFKNTWCTMLGILQLEYIDTIHSRYIRPQYGMMVFKEPELTTEEEHRPYFKLSLTVA